jgi:hypothetical protein
VNANETEEEVQGECLAFDDDLDFNADNIEIEEGDCVFMAMVHLVDPQHFVHASSMVSGRLAEAIAKNSMPKRFHKIVPTALHSHEDVFSKTAFNTLPQCQKWDHAIELEHEPSPSFQKVYLMTLTEQTEMDAFLEEALATGCIRQSKSLLGAPVFFIKKKDGKFCFVQDYQKIDTPSPSLTISSINSRACNTSPSSMYNGDTIMSASERVMSGRLFFEQIEVSSNY